MDYAAYPRPVVEDIARLRRCINASRLPQKLTDQNLIIGTWNIRAFGSIHQDWQENPGSPKRNLRALACLAEIARLYDVLSIQEVKRDTSGIRQLLEWLGPDWGMILTDVCAGEEGNEERLAFIFDRRRVTPSGLAGEIILPSTKSGDPVTQFARPPYLVGFRSAQEKFVLLTAHILYGKTPADRLEELLNLAEFTAREIRDRARISAAEEANLIVLGDFNIDKRGDNPLFQVFRSTGLTVPQSLTNLTTSLGSEPKYYDQIAWFMGDMDMIFQDAGVIGFSGAVFQELTLQQMSFRISDHLPLWAEFLIDRSVSYMARTLGIDPAMPDPLRIVPD